MTFNTEKKALEFPATSCLPFMTEDGDDKRCKSVESKVWAQLVDLEELKKAGLLRAETISAAESAQSAAGWDHWAVLVSVSTPYQTLDKSEDKTEFVSTAVIRRPRSIVMFEPGRAECTPTCHVPSGETRLDAMCYGKIEVEQGVTNFASIEGMKVRNDGPGYLYQLAVNRDFENNPGLSNPSSTAGFTMEPEKVFSFADNDGKGGLAPGLEVPVTDAKMPCRHELIIHNTSSMVEAGFDGSSTSVSESYTGVNNSRPSGTAQYTLSDVLPANSLRLDESGQAVPSTQTTRTIHTIIYYRGQN
jgi:hypothetical protein